MSTHLPLQFGKYTAIEHIGEGGFGEVYRAVDTSLNRSVALKLPHRELLRDPSFVAQFRQEARLAAQLDHPNIVRIYAIDEFEGAPYLEMELVEGQTLAQLIKVKGRFTPDEALAVVEPVCAALQEAHGKGIVHRDIKPQNILVRKNDGRVLVTDFGLAKATETSFQASLSSSNVVVGTFRYMPPEQANRKLGEIGPASDLYSLGVVLYEMLTGRVPFTSDSVGQLIYEHTSEPPEPPSNINIGVSRAVESVVLKALQKKPGDRFLSATAMAQAMRLAVKQDKTVSGIFPEKPPSAAASTIAAGTTPAAPSGRRRGRQGRGALTVAAIGIVAVLIVMAFIASRVVGPQVGEATGTPVDQVAIAETSPFTTTMPIGDGAAVPIVETTQVAQTSESGGPVETPKLETAAPVPTDSPSPADTPGPTDTPTPDLAATAQVEATLAQEAADATHAAETATSVANLGATNTVRAENTRNAEATRVKQAATQTAEAEKTAAQVAAMSATQTAAAEKTATQVAAVSATQTAAAVDQLGEVLGSPIPIEAVESDHPYAANEDQSQYISNDSGKNAMQVHFRRIEIENGVDRIEVRNAEDVLIQEITESYPAGLWTEIVPGAGAYIVLTSDSADTAWGYEIDKVAPVTYTTLAYSPHPYPNRSDASVILVNDDPNPPGTEVHFDRLELEEDVDYVVISDVDGNPYEWITGSYPQGFTSKTVPGSAIKIALISDGSVQEWGFNVDEVTSAPAETPDDPPGRPTELAASDHPYNHDFEKTWTITNPDVAAKSSKIHFSRVETEECCDFIQIIDSEGTVIQTISGKAEDFWTDYVPGRIVKVRFHSNGCCSNGWGFRVDVIAGAVPNPGLSQSNHPYGHDIRTTWTLTNPDVSAASSKVHFSRINTEACCDIIQLLDSQDTVIQTLSGDARDLWSDYVPGRIVKVRFISNGCCTNGWGYRVDAIANSVPNPGLAQSNHPYGHDLNRIWTITNPDTGASSSRVHFSRIDTEQCCDFVEILDSKDTVVQSLSGQLVDGWSDYIPGRVVKVRFRTNGCCSNGWGFRLDAIESK